jgi:hypothetical protein
MAAGLRGVIAKQHIEGYVPLFMLPTWVRCRRGRHLNKISREVFTEQHSA